VRERGPKLRETLITLAHGAGGKATRMLIEQVFLAAFENPALRPLSDAALLEHDGFRLAFTTDSSVVKPIFFPGGDIGDLAVNGTVNDLAVSGARPLALSAGFVIEEGFPVEDLRRVAASMAAAAARAGVPLATGDTKVVERGKADGVFITTTGIGAVPEGIDLSADKARPGDRVILSGTIGDHGVAVMSKRENLTFESAVISDSAALHGLVAAIIEAGASGLRVMRDPTRGGIAAALNELAQQSRVGFRLDEASLPVRSEVAAACELLGLDPLYVANEGKLVAIVSVEATDSVIAAMRAHPLGRDAMVIGEVISDDHCLVQMTTAFGGGRVVDWLTGEQLPRIC
jgi:hydrogenase expression/formation protein HypE